MRVLIKSLGIGMLCTGILIMGGCYQTDDPTVAIITVKDTNGSVVPEATVFVYCTSPGCCILPDCQKKVDSAVTGSSGTVQFNFKWEAVLRVRAQKTQPIMVDSAGIPIIKVVTFYGEDWVKLERHKTVEKDVVLREYQ